MELLSRKYAAQLGQSFGIEPLISAYERVKPETKKLILLITTRITECYVSETFASPLPALVNIICQENSRTNTHALKSLNQILQCIPAKLIPKYLTFKIAKLLSEYSDKESLSLLIGSLLSLSENRKHINQIILADINFERLFFSEDFKSNVADFQRQILNLVINILPRPSFPHELSTTKHRRPITSKDIALKIKPTIAKLLTNLPLCPELILTAFSAALSVQEASMTIAEAVSLSSLAMDSNIAPYVLATLMFYKRGTILINSDILNILSSHQSNFSWYKKYLKKLKYENESENQAETLQENSNFLDDSDSSESSDSSLIHINKSNTSSIEPNNNITGGNNYDISNIDIAEDNEIISDDNHGAFSENENESLNDSVIIHKNPKNKQSQKNSSTILKKGQTKKIHETKEVEKIENKNQRKYEKSSLSQIINEIRTAQLDVFSFFTTGAILRCIELLNKPMKVTEELQFLSDFAISLLLYIPHPPIPTPDSIDTFIRQLTTQEWVNILSPTHDQVSFSMAPLDQLASVEGWYNSEFQGFTVDRLLSLIQSNTELSGIIRNKLSNFKQDKGSISNALLSIFFRAFSHDNYPKMHIQYIEQLYSTQDVLYSALADSVLDPSTIFETVPMIMLINGDVQQSPPRMRSKGSQRLQHALELLASLHFCLGIPLTNEKFSNNLYKSLANPILSIGRFSKDLSTVYQFPFLFDFKLRRLVFQLTNLPLPKALDILINEYKLPSAVAVPKMEAIEVYVHRDSIFTDGLLIFKNFAFNHFPLSVQFVSDDKENSTGSGPNREFFNLFACELCKIDRRLFRSDNLQPGGICYSKNGLFPSPYANPALMEIFGIFLAKAISMECLIDIDLNEAFFDFIRGQNVSLKDVDPILANSLNQFKPDGFTTFIYPFYFSSSEIDANHKFIPQYNVIPLCQDGEKIIVTNENLHEYKKLVEEWTCGNKIRELSEAFRRGFSMVIPWQSLELFENKEILEIIRGEFPKFTMEDLQEYTDLGEEYRSEIHSSYINQFYQFLVDLSPQEQSMFLEFLTGSKRFPTGGISQIMPRISIQPEFFDNNQNPDNYYPYASTCDNTLYLPVYSSVQIMNSMLKYAIHEGLNFFGTGKTY